MKKNKLNVFILVILTVMVLFFILKDDVDDIIKTLAEVKILYLIYALMLLFISEISKTLGFYIVAKKLKHEYKLKEAFKLNLITNFFNGITPSSTGGQPYQIYYLNKRNNISYSKGTNLAFQNFLMRQIAFVIICTIIIVLNKIFVFVPIDLFLQKLILIGHSINVVILIVILLIYFDKKGDNFVIKKLILLIKKIGLLKENTVDRINRYLNNFHISMQELKNEKYLLLKGIVLFGTHIVSLFMIPLAVFYAVGSTIDVTITSSLVAIVFVYSVCSLVPIPGGTVGFEFGFITFFGFIVSGPVLKVAMLLWRFITYYFLTVLGSIIFLVDRKK